jgi:hypothetical protein
MSCHERIAREESLSSPAREDLSFGLAQPTPLTVRGKSLPWPFATWATRENAEAFRCRRPPRPAAAGLVHSLLNKDILRPCQSRHPVAADVIGSLLTRHERRSAWFVFLSLVVMLAFSAGCETQSPYVPVRGTVTLDGNPLESGVVRLQPSVGQVATGEIGPGGEFTLSTHVQGDGVLAGTYRVTVVAYDPSAAEPGPEHLIVPVRYTRSGTSGLQVTIFPGSLAPMNLSLVSGEPPAGGQSAAVLAPVDSGTTLGDSDLERNASPTTSE